MKKSILLFIFLSLSLSLNSAPPLGPWLQKKGLVALGFPREGFYQLKTLDQGSTMACGRHTVKNLQYVTAAIILGKCPKAICLLRQNCNKVKFEKLNRIVCSCLGIRNVQGTMTNVQMDKVLSELQTGELQRRKPGIRTVLPANSRHIASRMTPLITLSDRGSARAIFLEQYNTDIEVANILRGINTGRQLVDAICKIKQSNQKVLGIPIMVPDIKNLNNPVMHFATIVVHKVNNNKFEFFIVDSQNPRTAQWLPGLKFLKRLMTLSVNRLQTIKNLI